MFFVFARRIPPVFGAGDRETPEKNEKNGKKRGNPLDKWNKLM